MSVLQGWLSRFLNPFLNFQQHYVCFVRRRQSGAELTHKLGISQELLWKANPHIGGGFDVVFGGEVLLVPFGWSASFRRVAQKNWRELREDFDLRAWPLRADDFPTYPMKDRFIDPDWEPSVPLDLKPITGTAAKEATWGRFDYKDSTGDAIIITDGWEGKNIGSIELPGLKGIPIPVEKGTIPSKGMMRFNKKCHKQLYGLWNDWKHYGLLKRILTFDGAFVPRYMRKATHTRENLSNHSWGTAFDINAEWNKLGHAPAKIGQKGCVMDMVEIANQWGFYWGGHFGKKRADGMHFEVARIL